MIFKKNLLLHIEDDCHELKEFKVCLVFFLQIMQ